MKAIVDCNSFYCSCERLFRPSLEERPVVVLSNNDGCIIARTDEARALGIDMTGPYFMVKELIQQHGVAVFSSNYHLYGNMSWRVMETLRSIAGANAVEVYSVDEAFVDLKGWEKQDLHALALDMRRKVEQWTGIRVSIGIAPTKTLSKMANRLAKKDKKGSQCVWVLDTQEKQRVAMQQTAVGDIWGIGRQYAEKLKQLGWTTAWDLYQLPEEWVRKHLGGVVGLRLLRELHGQESITMKEQLEQKKMIATTRMFGRPVRDLASLREALAAYTSRAAEKLRRQFSAASFVQVFVVAKEKMEGPRFRHGPTLSAHTTLLSPTSLTHELLAAALPLLEQLYEEGRTYNKAGVILGGLVPDNAMQASLFEPPSKGMGRFLMDMVDNINFSTREGMVKFAATGTDRQWKMQQQKHSPRYTTRWDELCSVA